MSSNSHSSSVTREPSSSANNPAVQELIQTDDELHVDPDVVATFDVVDISGQRSIREIAEIHHTTSELSDGSYFEQARNPDSKLAAALEVISQTPAVLVKTRPSIVSTICGTDDFSRWEPFLVGFLETEASGQLLFRNVASLSEVAYTLSLRNQYLETHDSGGELDGDFSPLEYAHLAEHRAYTRYALESGTDEVWLDHNEVHAILGNATPISDALLVRSGRNGLYCGRGQLMADASAVSFELDRETTTQNERKVRVFNNGGARDALNAASDATFSETHLKYNDSVYHWECDLSGIERLIEYFLLKADVTSVSLHRTTELAIRNFRDGQFGAAIEGYEAGSEDSFRKQLTRNS